MRIAGREDNVNIILLRHKGIDLKLQCFTKPFPYAVGSDLEENKKVEIVFDDLREVDSLIDMLEKFRRKAQEYIGVWNRRDN